MIIQEEQHQDFNNNEEYLKHVNNILSEYLQPCRVDVPAMLFGASLVTIPFLLIYCGVSEMQEKSSEIIGGKIVKHVCTDKYGRDAEGRILNSAGLPKNPQTADDLPKGNLTVDMLIPSDIDQHGTCGIQV